VSGAVALLHDRWKWLANYPKVTNYVILNTAKDLGAPALTKSMATACWT